jgi:predicted enzyme related to lactoylglutathione lyase
MFERLRSPNAKWYSLGNSAEFSIPTTMRILVQDIDSVSPWYVEKLGLRKSNEEPPKPGSATFNFKADGHSVILTTRDGFQTVKIPILFAKKIGKVRDVLAARGAEVGNVVHDRQGIHYFEIHDPEGNVIEVVEER